MRTISETGHAKNAARFSEMVPCVSAYGTTYNPSNPSLSVPALQQLSADARNVLAELNAFLPAYSNAVAERDVAFKTLNTLVTRIMNALKAIKTSSQVDDNVRTLVRKIRGSRASAKKTEEEKQTLAAEGIEVREISSSQTSFDSRMENLDRLIKLLASITLYAPNEEDLKISGLTALYNELVTKNNAVVSARIPVSNARIARNKLLYNEDTGIVSVALAVKAYIKSIFGSTSPEYKQLTGFIFKSFKV